MCTFTLSSQIMCGDHPLSPKVTLTECRYEKYIDGTPHLLRREPEVAVKCLTCGRETAAEQLSINTKTVSGTFPWPPTQKPHSSSSRTGTCS